MWPGAKILIAPLKGCLSWGLMRMNMWIIEETSFGSDLATRALSLASLEHVFYQNQCQCVQENTTLVTVSGFSQIYYRQHCGAWTAGQVASDLWRSWTADKFRSLQHKQILIWQAAWGYMVYCRLCVCVSVSLSVSVRLIQYSSAIKISNWKYIWYSRNHWC